MSFELKHSESPGEGLARIAREEADDIIKMLGKKGDRVEIVHETRKSLKKIRSVIRLMRSALGEKVYKFENTFFRDAGHQLSDARDAQILLDSLNKLRKVDGAPARLLDALEEQFQSQRDTIHTMLDAKGVLRHLGETLQSSIKHIKNWPDADWDEVSSDLRTSYKNGRDALKEAQDNPKFETFHEWRKRAKDLNYQARLLHSIWPEVMQLVEDETHTLTENLGDDHDFGVLQGVVKHSPHRNGRAERKRLLELIDEQHDSLRREAKEIGEKLYQDKPKDFVVRLEALYSVW